MQKKKNGWNIINNSNDDKLSIINNGYGSQFKLYEIWLIEKKEPFKNSVIGYLDFDDIMKSIKAFIEGDYNLLRDEYKFKDIKKEYSKIPKRLMKGGLRK